MYIPFLFDEYCSESGTFKPTGAECENFQIQSFDIDAEKNIIIKVNYDDPSNVQVEDEDDGYIVTGVQVEVKEEDGSTGIINVNCEIGNDITEDLNMSWEVNDGVKINKYSVCPYENFISSNYAQKNVSKPLSIDMTIADNITEMANSLLQVSFCLSKAEVNMIENIGRQITKLLQDSSECLVDLLKHMNSSNWILTTKNINILIKISKTRVESHSELIKELKVTTLERAELAAAVSGMGFDYIGSDRPLRRELKLDRYKDKKVLILLYCKEFIDKDSYKFKSMLQELINIHDNSINIKNNDKMFLVVNLDIQDDLPFHRPTDLSLYYVINSKVVRDDYLQAVKESDDVNFVSYDGKHVNDLPKRRCPVIVKCPGENCSDKKKKWNCDDCQQFIEYGFDGSFYCQCGKGDIGKYTFLCSELEHGQDYVICNVAYVEKILKQNNPLKEINILLLGQSGVGKSTWINGIANYLKFKSMEDAKNDDLVCYIPSHFVVFDDDHMPHNIVIGKDKNENHKIGQSATQDCKTYQFVYNNSMYVNVIDTPGIADTRGIDQDRVHVKNILNHIRHKTDIHGICILLRPNEARLNVQFQFCVKELLTHLHMNAINNLIFCFTNSRSTSYKPGDTLPILKDLLHKVNPNISVDKDRIYCFDNEAFRFLCTLKYNIKFPQEQVRSFSMSWDRAVNETTKMIDFVSKLKPHDTQDTMTLNHARTIILSLTKPLAELTQNIETNIITMNEEQKAINNWTKGDEELEKNLKIKQVTFAARELGYPRTVCTAVKCTKYVKMPATNTTRPQYVTHCHPHCYLTNIIPEQYPNEGLKSCAAMSSGGLVCSKCRCGWDKHMHICYELVEDAGYFHDEGFEKELKSKSTILEKKELYMKRINTRINNLKKEKEDIIKVCVKFGYFLKSHAITPYNDALMDYLAYLIDQEANKPDKTEVDKELLKQLNATKAYYQAEVEMLEKSMTLAPDGKEFTSGDVERLERALYDLPETGSQLKGIMKVVKAAQDKHVAYDYHKPTNNRKYNKNKKEKNHKGYLSKFKDLLLEQLM